MRIETETTTSTGSSDRSTDRARRVWWVVVGLVAVGGVLRVWVAGQDLFGDELATYWVVSAHGLRGVVETVSTTAEITPPLSFVLSWLTTRSSLSPEAVRLPALVAGVASIPLVYAVGVRTVGRGAGLLAAALTTLSPFMIFYSAEARGYGVLMALVLASTLALLIALDDGRNRWWVAYGACVCLAAYTHYTAIFVLAVQFGWAFWARPRSRRPLLLATAGAVVLYLPWLPSLKADIDSPTTDILSVLSPFDSDEVRLTLAHWSIGFPTPNSGLPDRFAMPGDSLGDLPGSVALLLLVISIGVGIAGVVTMRSRLRAWFAAHGGHLGLIVLLALATPIGTALQSAVGANVFRTRSLAASWPYLALAVAALITVGRPALRITAAGLAVTAFALGTAQMTGTNFQRPPYSTLAQFTHEHPGSIVVDGAAFTPGPLTNFDIEGIDVLRLSVPEQDTVPFSAMQPRPTPADIAERAIAAADGGPITVIAFSPQQTTTQELIDLLPPDYELTDTKRVDGLLDLQALVYERTAPTG